VNCLEGSSIQRLSSRRCAILKGNLNGYSLIFTQQTNNLTMTHPRNTFATR